MGNNKKMSENDVGEVWVQNLIIFGLFPTSAGFRAKSQEILSETFLSHADEKR